MFGVSLDARDLPRGPFTTIVADPPWNYSDKLSAGGNSGFGALHHSRHGSTRGAAAFYETMRLEDIVSLPVESVAAEQSHLYLWTTSSFMREALTIVEAWGFTFKQVLTWVKVRKNAVDVVVANGTIDSALRMGMGRYYRMNSEFVLFCVRGKTPLNRKDIHSVFFAERGRHSAKPERFFKMVEIASDGPRLEMFARGPREGWTVWGDEAEPPTAESHSVQHVSVAETSSTEQGEGLNTDG